MPTSFDSYLKQCTAATRCEEIEMLQSLWSGYGKISRYRLHGSGYETVIVKHVNLPAATAHPRGWNSRLGHLRKVRSYEVEIAWYKQYALRHSQGCRMPALLGAHSATNMHWIVLEDLGVEFDVDRDQISLDEVKTCLRWLAHFHYQFMGIKPEGLWETGTYWHLATRTEELAAMEHAKLKALAPEIDRRLSAARFQTLVHGDAKLANFCFARQEDQVAALDFQYVV